MTSIKTRSVLLLVICALLGTAVVKCEDAESLQQKGVDLLKDSQIHPHSIVDAARYFAKAAQAYVAAGSEDKAVEMNSYLYWCKKKMNMEDIDAFTKGGEVEVVASLNAAAEKTVDANAAQAWLDRAEAFADSKPDEHFQIAIRFYEVADRFKGSEISLKAQDRSLKEQGLALEQAAAPARTSVPVRGRRFASVPADVPVVDEPPAALEATVKLPAPMGAKLKEAEFELRNILKEEYSKTQTSDRLALARKLNLMADDANNDPVTKYLELREASSLAATAGDVSMVSNMLRKLDVSFTVDVTALKAVALKEALDATKSKDVCRAVADAALTAIDESILLDQFDSLRAITNLAETACGRALNPELTAQMKNKSAYVGEILREWPSAKTAFEKLKLDAGNSTLWLTAGKFECFFKGDSKHGLPMLSKSLDPVLKKLADADLAEPKDVNQQVLAGDGWWDLSEKERSKRAQAMMLTRAAHWYTKALPRVAGISRVKLDKRIATITKTLGPAVVSVDLSGKWSVTWTAHPLYGNRACEFRADGSIVVSPAENFGSYKPSKWTARGKQVVIYFTNGESSIYKLLSESAFKQEDGGDAMYSRTSRN